MNPDDYQRKLAVIESALLRCRNCRQLWSNHVDGKCLYDAGVWTPVTLEQRRKEMAEMEIADG